jgi:hypothetical protein
MGEQKYTTNVGDFIVISITGGIETYIAEVMCSDPLRLKVKENGPFANLRDDDFIINAEETRLWQKDVRENTCVYLEQKTRAGIRVLSGLKSLKVYDNRLHEILPRK